MRALAVSAGFGLALLLGGLPRGAAAEEQKPASQEKDKEKEKRQGAVVDPATGKRFNEALEHINNKRYAEARATLSKLNPERLSPYELSRVEQLLAAVDQSDGKYGSAREHLAKAISSGGLNDQEASAARFQIAQLFMAEDKWREGVAALKEWFATATNPNSAAYHLLAVAYYQLGDHKSAVEPAQKAVDLSGGKPQESWLQLLLALRLEREEYKLAIPILRQLIEASPMKKQNWLQLSGVNASLGSYEDAAVPLQLAYHAGLLTEDQELRRLVEILARNTIPHRAAQILSQALEQGRVKSEVKSYELLANCWVAAKEFEKSIQPLRKAADLSESGELYVRLAEVYVQREEWANASGVLRLALDKGKLKNPGNAQLLMGLAVYKQKNPQDARTWFQRARDHSETRGQADAWLRHIEDDLSEESGAQAAGNPPAGKS